MEEAIVVEDVRKRYGDTVALDGVSLAADGGAVLALVGPNGAGKTTLVRTIAGTTSPDAGTVRVLGEDPAAVDRDVLGVLPQSFSPPARLTARELLRYYAGLYDDPRDPEAVLSDVGVAGAGDTAYEALSGGQQRRVCVGATLVNDPEVLLLDEPTTGIDPEGRRTVRRLVDDLADRGATVVVTTHDMDEAERLADRVALLADGRLRAVGSPEALVEEYGGRPRLLVEPAAGADEAVERALADAGYEVSSDVGASVLTVRDVAPEEIGGVVEALAAAGEAYEGLEWRRPSLEDAYVALASEDRADAASANDSRDHDARTGTAAPTASENPTAGRGGDDA